MVNLVGMKECGLNDKQRNIIEIAQFVCGVGSLCGPVGTAIFAGPGIMLSIYDLMCDDL